MLLTPRAAGPARTQARQQAIRIQKSLYFSNTVHTRCLYLHNGFVHIDKQQLLQIPIAALPSPPIDPPEMSTASTASSGTKRKRGSEMKFYAVRAGHKPGIYHSWNDCKEQITGFKGAVCELPGLISDLIFVSDTASRQVLYISHRSTSLRKGHRQHTCLRLRS